MRRLFLPLAALLAAMVLGLSALVSGQGPAAPGSPLVLLSASGRRTLQTTGPDQAMVALDDLANAFQLTLRDDPLAGGMTVGYKGKSIVIMADQSIASVAGASTSPGSGRVISLSAPVLREGRRWLVPLDFIPKALALIYDVRLDLRKASHLVVIGDLRVPRVLVREEAQGGQARITIDASPKTATVVSTDQNRLLVKFDADALDASIAAAPLPGFVEGVHVTDPGNTIAILLGPRFGSYRNVAAAGDNATSRVVIDLLPPGPAAAVSPPPVAGPPPGAPPAAAAAPPPPTAGAVPRLEGEQAGGVGTIVIDPGHGGAEQGARGASGLLEKDLALAVARRLKAAIEGRLGLRAMLTREGDTEVSLDERTALANNNKADLFISLHANASLRKEKKGAEVFYLGDEGSVPLPLASSGTVLPAFGGGSREVGVVLWDHAQTRHLAESAQLAAIVRDALREHVPMTEDAIEQAPFRVLTGANMPAVLVEMGFLTNAEQDQALATSEFQAAIVQGLFDAIVRYRDVVEHGRTAATAVTSTTAGPR